MLYFDIVFEVHKMPEVNDFSVSLKIKPAGGHLNFSPL
jgi:hypothetical protein